MVVYGERKQINPALFRDETLLKTVASGFLYGKFSKKGTVLLFYDSDIKNTD